MKDPWLGHWDGCSCQYSNVCDCDPDNPIDFSAPPPCSAPASNHGDGRGCDDENCPRHGGEPMPCSGECLSGYDIGIPGPGIAYPHPDCPAHGSQWEPDDNEWSRQYVRDHPERFPTDH